MSPSLRDSALRGRSDEACSAIAQMVRSGDFLLTESDLSLLEGHRGELLAGWAFRYRVAMADRAGRSELLRLGAESDNPRIREQVCDIIGDEGLAELRPVLLRLRDDAIPFVVEAAIYNCDQMLDA